MSGLSEVNGSMNGKDIKFTLKSIMGNGPVGTVTGVEEQGATLTGEGCANASFKPIVIDSYGGGGLGAGSTVEGGAAENTASHRRGTVTQPVWATVAEDDEAGGITLPCRPRTDFHGLARCGRSPRGTSMRALDHVATAIERFAKGLCDYTAWV